MAINNEYAAAILTQMFANGVTSDQITLIAGIGGRRMPIHRAVLMAGSEYFKASLGPSFVEGGQTEFILDGTDADTLEAIVRFCYTGSIDLTEVNVSKYLAIASSVDLYWLEQMCCRSLAEKISVNNAAQTWMIADKYSLQGIRQRTLLYICGSIEKFPIESIRAFDHRLLQEILKSDYIPATEEFIFKRLLDWFRFNEDERKQYMCALLRLIRLELIPSQILNDIQLEATYKQFQCFDLILAEYKKRSLIQSLSAGIRRLRSIFCLFREDKGENGAKYSEIKIERFNSASNEFEKAGRIKLGNRILYELALHENKLYILGGCVNQVYSKTVVAFDLNTRREEIVPGMNVARAGVSPIVHAKHLYVFGGSSGVIGPDGTRNRLNSCERFDMETKTWTNLKPMKTGRFLPSATVLNGFIYIAGGRENGNVLGNTVEIYDPENDEWVEVASMNEERSSFALFKMNRFLYAIGSTSTVERYDSLKARWTMVGSFSKCDEVTSSVETDDGVFVVKRSGAFGKIDLDANGICSFILLTTSKYKSEFRRRHYLFQN